MKIILSIIITFLSAQSFADLEGKALSCIFKNSDGRVFHKGVEQPSLKGTLPATPKRSNKNKNYRRKHSKYFTKKN